MSILAKFKSTAVVFGAISVWLCCVHASAGYKTQYTIAKDGSGDFKTISAALLDVKSFPDQRITLFVKNGTYREKVHVQEWNTQLSLIGQSRDGVVITWSDHFKAMGKGRNSTFYTASVQVSADDFVAKNITIKNTAGPVGQAIALSVNANRAVFNHVHLVGHQDTLYVTGAGNQMLFKNSVIEGTTDFIFGGASAVFDRCTILSKANSYITAASTPKGEPFGLVFVNSHFTAMPGISNVYLGRPWRSYAQTVVVNSTLDGHIHRERWHDWGKLAATKTVFYAEGKNKGPGAALKGGVDWMHLLKKNSIDQFRPQKLFQSSNSSNWYLRGD